jgi:hypothetical protein
VAEISIVVFPLFLLPAREIYDIVGIDHQTTRQLDRMKQMCDNDIQMQQTALLRQILAALQSDQYEYSDPYTIGGPNGLYQLRTPWNTECEWWLVSVAGNVNQNAIFSIGSKNPNQPTINFGSGPSIGLVSSGTDSAMNSFIGQLSVNSSMITYDRLFLPLAGNSLVYFNNQTTAGGVCYATIVFRRSYAIAIPDTEYRSYRPQAHKPTVPRKDARTFVEALRENSLVATMQDPSPVEALAGDDYDGGNAPNDIAPIIPAAHSPIEAKLNSYAIRGGTRYADQQQRQPMADRMRYDRGKKGA